MDKKEDLRVIKTKNILYNTLLEVLKEKPFEEIKVSDICNRALVNRSTFYAHYSDKYELFSSYISDLKESLISELKKNENIHTSKEYFLEMIRLFLNHIEEKKNFYSSIMVNNRNSIIMYMLYNTFNTEIKEEIEKKGNIRGIPVPTSFISKFYLGAVISIGMDVIENPNKYKKEELVKYFDYLIPEEPYRK